MPNKLTFEIELLSDYHVGAGFSQGQTDSILLRDSDGLPSLRGTLLTGLLRDGLRGLLESKALQGYRALCKASGNPAGSEYCRPGEEACLVCSVFGTPFLPKPWAISSARPVGAQKPVKKISGGWAAQTAWRVRVSPRTRQAEARKLFSHEEGDQRLRFLFDITRQSDFPSSEAEAALLIAAARMVRSLGAHRRRGMGACILRLKQVDGQDADQGIWLDKFKQHWLDHRGVLGQEPIAEPVFTPAGDSTEGIYRLRLVIRTEEPLLIARRAQAANEFEGLDYIPANTLRGGLARLASRPMKSSGGAVYRQDFQRLFFTEAVRFSALYPVLMEASMVGVATIRTPLDWLTCKLHGAGGTAAAGVLWSLRSLEPTSPKDACPLCRQMGKDTEVKAVGGFTAVQITTQQTRLAMPEIKQKLEMHIRMDPENGRVVSGQLYGYQAMPVGTFFAGDLVFSSQKEWETLRALSGLPKVGEAFDLWLGKATRRGYGRVRAVFEQVPAGDPPTWIGRSLDERLDPNDPVLLITLLSDTIVCDAWGRASTGFETGWLADNLGVTPEQLIVERQVVSHSVLDGFNVQHGLPRWREIVLAAGSSARVRLVQDPSVSPGGAQPRWDLDRLESCEQHGIGLYCNQGYGRVAFNHPSYPSDPARSSDTSGWTQASFLLPVELRLGSMDGSGPVKISSDFCQAWSKKLRSMNKTLQSWSKVEFAPVARLLHTLRFQPVEKIHDRFQQLGNREQFGLPAKDAVWYQTNGKGKEGLLSILQALKDLDKLLDEKRYRSQRDELEPLGIAMLAEQIAHQAGKDN